MRKVFSDSRNVPIDKKESYSKNLEYYVEFGNFVKMLKENISLFSKEENSDIYVPQFDLFLDGKEVKKINIYANDLVINFEDSHKVFSISEHYGSSKEDLLKYIRKIEKISKNKKCRLHRNFERDKCKENSVYGLQLKKFINMVKTKKNLFKEASYKFYNGSSKKIEKRGLGFYRPTFGVFIKKSRVNYICFENDNLVVGFEDFNRDFSICEQHGNSEKDLYFCIKEIRKAAKKVEKNQDLYKLDQSLPVVCESFNENDTE